MLQTPEQAIPAPGPTTGGAPGSSTAPAHGWLPRLLHRAVEVGSQPRCALPLSLVLVALIGAADYVTAYEARLAILYVIPLALATWTCGRRQGILITLLATATWAASFSTRHRYSNDVYFFWDCIVMAATLLILVELLRVSTRRWRARTSGS